MSDLWTDEGFGGGAYGGEGFGGDDDWDEGEESLETDVEEGFADLEELEDDEGWDAEDDE
jgi:hypothetical protein